MLQTRSHRVQEVCDCVFSYDSNGVVCLWLLWLHWSHWLRVSVILTLGRSVFYFCCAYYGSCQGEIVTTCHIFLADQPSMPQRNEGTLDSTLPPLNVAGCGLATQPGGCSNLNITLHNSFIEVSYEKLSENTWKDKHYVILSRCVL